MAIDYPSGLYKQPQIPLGDGMRLSEDHHQAKTGEEEDTSIRDRIDTS
jgi:hypothetical protein